MKNNLFTYIGIVLIILMSGSYLYDAYYLLFFALSMLYIMVCFMKHSRAFSSFFRTYGFYFIVLTFVNILVNGLGSNMFINYCISPALVYSLCCTMTFDSFRKDWLNLISIISAWALIAFVLLQVGYPASTANFGSIPVHHILGINMRVAENRLCGLSFEPGVFQILLIYTILMWIDKIRIMQLTKNEKAQLLLCLVALLATQSSMGYFGLIAVLGGLVITPKFSKVYGYKGIFVLALIFAASFYLYTSPIIQNKLNEEDGNMSFTIRMMDTMSVWQIFTEHPIFGAGVETPLWKSLAASYGNVSSSNGNLNMMSRLGIFWLIGFVVALYKNGKRLKLGMLKLYFVFAVMLPLFNEDQCYSPIGFLFVLPFLKDQLYRPTYVKPQNSISNECENNSSNSNV